MSRACFRIQIGGGCYDLPVKMSRDKSECVLTHGVIVEGREDGPWAGFTLEIPPGFRFDGASVPRAFWWLIRPFGPNVVMAALVHDCLYAHGLGCRRAEADRIFLRLLEHEGMGRIRRELAYWAVRAFGRRAWRRPKG